MERMNRIWINFTHPCYEVDIYEMEEEEDTHDCDVLIGQGYINLITIIDRYPKLEAVFEAANGNGRYKPEIIRQWVKTNDYDLGYRGSLLSVYLSNIADALEALDNEHEGDVGCLKTPAY